MAIQWNWLTRQAFNLESRSSSLRIVTIQLDKKLFSQSIYFLTDKLGENPDGTVTVRANKNKRKKVEGPMDIDDLIFQDGYEVVISKK